MKRHISLIVRLLARGGHLPIRGVATASSTLCVSTVLTKGKQVFEVLFLYRHIDYHGKAIRSSLIFVFFLVPEHKTW